MSADVVEGPVETPASSPSTAKVRQNPHYVLGVLYLICVFSYVDRQLIALLAPAIQKELHLKDWQLGFVSGTAFAVLYVFMGVPLSRLADRTHRVRMLGVCLAAWSITTAACGLVTSFVQLALARMGVAIGEAGGYPPSLSIISDIYPPQRRATAMSVFFSGTTAGALVSLIGGGLAAQALGWRWTFALAALPGLLLTPLLLASVREPVRGQADEQSATTASPIAVKGLWTALAALFGQPLYRWMAIAMAVYNLELFSLAAWTPSYALRTFGLGTAKVGLGLGLALGVGSGFVMIAAGVVADRLAKRSRTSAVYIAVAGQVLFIPLFLAALQAHGFVPFCVLYALAYGASASGGAMMQAATQGVIPADVRGTGAALLVMVATLAGYGLGPPLIGAMSDMLATGTPAQRLGVALRMGTAFDAIAAVLMLWGVAVASRKTRQATSG